jgi:DNA-binding response OmpR family regulator
MDSDALKGLIVLVAEDEYMIATDLAQELTRAGARVLGPVSSLDGALELLKDADHIDAAILDVNLQGEKIFPAAEMLEQHGVPFLFATGYDESVIPAHFGSVLRCEKPIGSKKLSQVLATIINTRP